jgi:hypothetical protein
MITFESNSPGEFEVMRDHEWIGTVSLHDGKEPTFELASNDEEGHELTIEEMRQVVAHFDEIKAKP